MKFPKNRGGWSGQGRTDARFLDESAGGEWQRKRRVGSEARNKGGYLVVIAAPENAVDGYYSYGSTPANIRASATSRGEWSLRGPAPTSAFNVPNMLPIGNGRGAYGYDLDYDLGGQMDEFGYICPVSTVSWGYTRNGKDIIARGSFFFVGSVDYKPPNFGALRYGLFTMNSGSYYDGGFKFAMTYDDVLSSGQHAIRHGIDNGTSVSTYTAAVIPGQIIRLRSSQRITPKVLLCLGAALIPNSEATGWSAAGFPGFFWRYTLNGGVTWQDVASAAITETESNQFKSIAAGSIPAITRTRANDHASYALMNVVALTATTALVYMLVPYFNDDESPGFYASFAKVKTGIFDTTTGSISQVAVLFDGPANQAYAFWERGAVPAPGGGVLLMQNPAVLAPDTAFPTIYFTEDGVTLTPVGNFPRQASHTGLFSNESKTTLLCPMFDGKCSLYASKDKGATWSRRGTISPDTVIPPYDGPGTATALRSYGVVTYLRDNGMPTNVNPGQPWLSDERVPFP